MVLPCSRHSVSTVPSAFQKTVAITFQMNATKRHYLRSSKEACSQAMLCTLLLGSKWWSQVSSAVTTRETKLSAFSLNRRNRLVNASTQFAYWTSDAICGTDRADTQFINRFADKIKCTLSVEMPTDAATKPTDSCRSVMTRLTFQQLWREKLLVVHTGASHQTTIALV